MKEGATLGIMDETFPHESTPSTHAGLYPDESPFPDR